MSLSFLRDRVGKFLRENKYFVREIFCCIPFWTALFVIGAAFILYYGKIT